MVCCSHRTALGGYPERRMDAPARPVRSAWEQSASGCSGTVSFLHSYSLGLPGRLAHINAMARPVSFKSSFIALRETYGRAAVKPMRRNFSNQSGVNPRHKSGIFFTRFGRPENIKHPMKSVWCPGAESNHRHCDFQSHALPTELPGHAVNPARSL